MIQTCTYLHASTYSLHTSEECVTISIFQYEIDSTYNTTHRKPYSNRLRIVSSHNVVGLTLAMSLDKDLYVMHECEALLFVIYL